MHFFILLQVLKGKVRRQAQFGLSSRRRELSLGTPLFTFPQREASVSAQTAGALDVASEASSTPGLNPGPQEQRATNPQTLNQPHPGSRISSEPKMKHVASDFTASSSIRRRQNAGIYGESLTTLECAHFWCSTE